MFTLPIGETRWRMLRAALKFDVFCYHDLRQPSRKDVANFEFLLDNGLFALAPAGAVSVRRNNYAVKVGDPLGLFVVTEKGRAVADTGLYERTVLAVPAPSAALVRRPPLKGNRPSAEGWEHAALPEPQPPGTLYRAGLALPPISIPLDPPAPTNPAKNPVPKKPAAKKKPKAKAVKEAAKKRAQ